MCSGNGCRIVTEVGENVKTGIKIGESVMGMVMPNGIHGAYMIN